MVVHRPTYLLPGPAAPRRRKEAPRPDTTDGVALLKYAGLGATAEGTKPGDWMAPVLHGT